jgi:hypothetical protein
LPISSPISLSDAVISLLHFFAFSSRPIMAARFEFGQLRPSLVTLRFFLFRRFVFHATLRRFTLLPSFSLFRFADAFFFRFH